MSKRFQFRHPGFGVSFLPTDLSGLTLWLDAEDSDTLFQDSAGTTPAEIGDVVGLWTDKSGNGFDASQATTASKPIRRAGKLEFDGGDDFLEIADGLDGYSAITWFIKFELLRLSSVSATNQTLLNKDNASFGARTYRTFVDDADDSMEALLGNGDTFYGVVVSGSAALALTNTYVTEFWFDGINGEHFLDGNADGTDGNTQNVADTATTTRIGGAHASGLYVNAYISEIVMFNRALTDSERATMRKYLS